MTDMAIQVSPVPTEEEMSKTTDMISRGIAALRALPDLNQKVDALTHKVGELQKEVNSVRDTNAWLQGRLQEVTQERNAANEAKAKAESDRDDISRKLTSAEKEIDDRNSLIDRQTNTVEKLNRALDEMELRTLHAEELNTQLRSKLDEAMVWMAEVAEMLNPPKQAEKWPEEEAQDIHREAMALDPEPSFRDAPVSVSAEPMAEPVEQVSPQVESVYTSGHDVAGTNEAGNDRHDDGVASPFPAYRYGG